MYGGGGEKNTRLICTTDPTISDSEQPYRPIRDNSRAYGSFFLFISNQIHRSSFSRLYFSSLTFQCYQPFPIMTNETSLPFFFFSNPWKKSRERRKKGEVSSESSDISKRNNHSSGTHCCALDTAATLLPNERILMCLGCRCFGLTLLLAGTDAVMLSFAATKAVPIRFTIQGIAIVLR